MTTTGSRKSVRNPEDECGSHGPDEDSWLGRQPQRRRMNVCSLTSAFLLFPETLTRELFLQKNHGSGTWGSGGGLQRRRPQAGRKTQAEDIYQIFIRFTVTSNALQNASYRSAASINNVKGSTRTRIWIVVITHGFIQRVISRASLWLELIQAV